LPILRDRGGERNLFSLEMGPDGVRLRLGSAVLEDWLVIRDLVLLVPHVPRSFDYTAGPRSLQSALTHLEGVVIELRLDGLVSRMGNVTGITVAGFRALEGRIAVSGTVDEAPFTLRLALGMPGSEGAGDVVVRFEDPRVYGWIGRSWDRLGSALGSALPAVLRVDVDRSRAIVEVLRPALMPLLAGMGCKVPLVDGVELSSVEVRDGRVSLRFGKTSSSSEARVTGLGVVSGGIEPTESPLDPETEARIALRDMALGGNATDAGARLLTNGVASPRLWPEVLVASRTLGEDRPEWVLPHLVGVLLASRMPEIVSRGDVAVLARRLLTAVEASGDVADLALAGRLVATVTFDLEPGEALALVDAVRARGVSDPVVLEAAALALDRLGRGVEARAVRARLLALAPAGRTSEILRSVVDRLDRAGLEAVANAWLDETLARCDEGRFGAEGAAIRRRTQLLCAARESLAGDAGGRRRLLDLLRQDPSDREALDLLAVTSRTDREAAEAVARLREAADGTSGSLRSGLLRDAARVTADRLGLRRQAVLLLEEALEAAPRDVEAADALDRLCSELGLDERRLALARVRLSWTGDPEARVEALLRVARLAEKTGAVDEAARSVAEILRCDPTNREALEAGIRVFAAAGDEAALVDAWDTLLDLDAR
jgi:tetratricopeptide (TPR) repeat protein